jgi:RNA polymerase sigma-70 factor (ECF subfamily)
VIKSRVIPDSPLEASMSPHAVLFSTDLVDAPGVGAAGVDSRGVDAPRPVRSVPRHDDATFEASVLEHFPCVWRFLRRLGVPASDVDDAAQEVVLVAARKRLSIAPGSERAFLMSTAFRVARRMRCTQVRRAELSDDALALVLDAGPGPESAAMQRQERAVLDVILSEMPLELRAVFVLCEIEEQSVHEIARVLEIPIGTAASRLRRARADFEGRVRRLELRTRSRARRRP